MATRKKKTGAKKAGKKKAGASKAGKRKVGAKKAAKKRGRRAGTSIVRTPQMA
ncbi:MAG: hypothetical protein ACREV5_17775 [Steroidobacter sp.]